MPRIRSIKPEFWKSETIAALPVSARLTFIGLWSYVDDNGVGRDIEKLIAAEIYPLEDDPRETLATVSRDLQTLYDAGRILRYTVAGKPFLSIVNWTEHQRIDKPNKARYPEFDQADEPLTCGSGEPRDTLATPSREGSETPAPGAVEVGTGEQRIPSETDADVGALVAGFIERCRERPPSNYIGRIGKEIRAMVKDGIAENAIKGGLTIVAERGLQPTALPGAVHEWQNARPRQTQTRNQVILDAAMERARAAESEQKAIGA